MEFIGVVVGIIGILIGTLNRSFFCFTGASKKIGVPMVVIILYGFAGVFSEEAS